MISDSLAFRILSIFGCWLTNESSEIKSRKVLYWIYSLFVFANLYLLNLLCVIHMIIEFQNDVESVIETFITYAALLFVCCKIKVLIFNRNDFIKLDNSLSDNLLAAKAENEIQIHNYCNKKLKYIIIVCTILAEMCGMLFCAIPLISKEKRESRELPLKIWLPFKVDDSNFRVLFIWQVVLFVYGCAIHCCSDCIFVEFIEHGCAKLTILASRLESVSKIIKSGKKANMKKEDISKFEKQILRPLFIQHQLIYK